MIKIDDPGQKWVSRAALKLIEGLEQTGFDVEGKTALDIGASTGGFTQVLLERGAHHVYAIDVGHDQMDHNLATHPRVTNLEGINARDLRAGNIDNVSPEVIVSDVSFISLKLALPSALEMAQTGALGVFLVKPQFEVGRETYWQGRHRARRRNRLWQLRTIFRPGWNNSEAGVLIRFTPHPLQVVTAIRSFACRSKRWFKLSGWVIWGDGIFSENGNEIYVPFGLPGDDVELTGDGARKDIASIVSPSDNRVEPICQHFGGCGGAKCNMRSSNFIANGKNGL